MLEQARRKVEATGIQNVEFIEADASSIHFNDNSFDVIFCCSAITYLPDVPATLQKWYRFLKPGGLIAFTCPAETAYLAPIQVKVCAELFNIPYPTLMDPWILLRNATIYCSRQVLATSKYKQSHLGSI